MSEHENEGPNGPGSAAAAGDAAGGGRREELLAAAEATIVERGLRGLTVDEVVTRAGVAKGTFYLYFGAKADLVGALRERYVATMVAQHVAALDALPPGDHAARLDRWIADSIDSHLEHERLHDALFHHELPALAVKTGVDPANPQLDLLSDVLRAGAAAGAFQLPDPDTTAALLYGALHAAVDLLLGDESPPAAETVASVVLATQRLARGAVGAS